MAFYDEDAMLFGAVGELQDGREAIRAYFGKRGPEARVKSYPEVRQFLFRVTTGYRPNRSKLGR